MELPGPFDEGKTASGQIKMDDIKPRPERTSPDMTLPQIR